MTVRLCTPSFHPHPLSTHSKSAHRGARRPDRPREPRGVRHRAPPRSRLVPDRDPPLPRALARALPAEVRHPVRRARAERREGHPGAHGGGIPRVPRRQLAEFYAPLVVSDEARPRPRGRLARVDTRLRDALRSLGFGEGAAAGSEAIAFETPGCRRRRPTRASPRRSRSPISGSPSANASTRSSGISSLERRRAVVASARGRSLARMRRTWGDCSPSSPRAARPSLFLLALAVFWLEALGWPMAKGRDTWDYLAYYLQLLDSDPPLSELQLFRTPVTPLVLGIPLDLGGSLLLEAVFGVLFATAILAWSAFALTFGRIPALFSASCCSRTRRTRRSTTRRRATRSSPPASRAGRSSSRGRWSARPGGGSSRSGRDRGPRPHPGGERDPPSARPRAARRRGALAQAARLVGGVPRGRGPPLAAWAALNGVALRLDDRAARRTGVGAVPARVHRRPHDLRRRTATLAAPRRPRRARGLGKEPHAGLGVTLEEYFANGSNYETVSLIALSDRVLGQDENYDVLFESALEAIREHPRTYFRGVADTYWDFLMQAPLREDVVPREQTAEAPPCRRSRAGVVLPNPQAHALEAVPYGFVWCASDYIDSCTVEDPRSCGRTTRGSAGTARSSRRCGLVGCRPALARGVSFVPELLNRITPRFPRPPLWLLWGRSRSWSGDRAARAVLALWLAAGLVLLVRGLPGRRTGVRPAAVPDLHRDGARRGRERPAREQTEAPGRAGSVDPRARAHGARRALRFATLDAQSFWLDELVTVSLLDRGFGEMLDGVRRPRRRRTCTTCSPGRGRGVRARRGGAAVALGARRDGSRSRSRTRRAPRSGSGGSVPSSRLSSPSTRSSSGTRRRHAYSLLVLLGACTVLFLGRALRAPPRRPRALGHAVVARDRDALLRGVPRRRRGRLAPRAVPGRRDAAWLCSCPPPSSSRTLPLLDAQRSNGETVADTSLLSRVAARRRRSSSATASPRRSPGASSRPASSPSGSRSSRRVRDRTSDAGLSSPAPSRSPSSGWRSAWRSPGPTT